MIDYSKSQFLVVDDFSDFRTSVKNMLKQMAVQHIDTAANAKEALELCRLKRYDIVLHDYNLGAGKNGQQVLEELHERKLMMPHCIFVMVTAETSQAMVMSAIECEPDAYLTKPFNRASLQQRLDKLVQRKQALKPVLDAVHKGDHQTVVEACQQVMRDQPKYRPQCLRYQANALEALGQDRALEKMLTAIMADRPLPWALVALADLYRRMGQLDKAENLLEQGVRQFPMLPMIYDGLAAVYRDRDDLPKVQQWLEQGLRISPHALHRQVELGTVARQNQDSDAALKAWRQAVDLGRNSVFHSAESHLSLAATLNDQLNENPDPKVTLELRQTLTEMEQSWSDDPGLQVRSNLLQASALQKTGKSGEASALLSKAQGQLAQLDTFFSPQAALDVADNLRELGQADQAEQMLATCAEMYGDDPSVMQQIAGKTDNPALLDTSKRAAELNRQGIQHYQQKNYPQALEAFRQSQKLQPRNISFALNTAQSLLRLMATEPDPALKEECRLCLQQVRSIPPSDSRYERYLKLCKHAEAS
ncbi:tetratricopeptide repeat-containing response regulator [Halopseudomonas salegens]|nr:tetratricopeptide repeat-containing response regulator [Halopseudomonas salegens]